MPETYRVHLPFSRAIAQTTAAKLLSFQNKTVVLLLPDTDAVTKVPVFVPLPTAHERYLQVN